VARTTGSYGTGEARIQNTRRDEDWQGRKVVAIASASGAQLFDPKDGSMLAVLAPDGKAAVSYEPSWYFGQPLSVGKTWTKSYRMTLHASNKVVPYDVSCKVESHDDVTVPAGTFKAFKIACTNTIGTDEQFWVDPRYSITIKSAFQRSAVSPFGAGTRESELLSLTLGN
jgi:hypothetical protein